MRSHTTSSCHSDHIACRTVTRPHQSPHATTHRRRHRSARSPARERTASCHPLLLPHAPSRRPSSTRRHRRPEGQPGAPRLDHLHGPQGDTLVGPRRTVPDDAATRSPPATTSATRRHHLGRRVDPACPGPRRAATAKAAAARSRGRATRDLRRALRRHAQPHRRAQRHLARRAAQGQPPLEPRSFDLSPGSGCAVPRLPRPTTTYRMRSGDTKGHRGQHGTYHGLHEPADTLLVDSRSRSPAPPSAAHRHAATRSARRRPCIDLGPARSPSCRPGAAPRSARPRSTTNEAAREHLRRTHLPRARRQRGQPQPRGPRPHARCRAAAQTKAMIVATARRHGVDPKLALAVGWQESGWNQRQVSVANADRRHAGHPLLRPVGLRAWPGARSTCSSTQDNITAGVVILRSLTRSATNLDQAIAGYYQGLYSVQQQRHVRRHQGRTCANIKAHRAPDVSDATAGRAPAVHGPACTR